MKNIAIGDLHGKNVWKQIDPTQYDNIVFIGDYLDSFIVSDNDMMNNLADIIEFAKTYSNVTLLIGNHEIHYLVDNLNYAGYRASIASQAKSLLKSNMELFSFAKLIDNTLLTHAGLTDTWYNKHAYEIENTTGDDLIEKLNNIYYTKFYDVLLTKSKLRGGISTGSILWADLDELIQNPFNGYNQIVGHTPVDEILNYNVNGNSLTFIDCVGIQIENNKSVTFYEF